MVITQRVTSLAYSLQDTMTQKEINANGSHSSVGQLSTKIEKIPSPLEYFAFTLAFQTLMCGPVVFYSDYIDFIEGARVDVVSTLVGYMLGLGEASQDWQSSKRE